MVNFNVFLDYLDEHPLDVNINLFLICIIMYFIELFHTV